MYIVIMDVVTHRLRSELKDFDLENRSRADMANAYRHSAKVILFDV